MTTKTRAEQVSGGVFLIGLALLFMTGFWWPGILFVLGATAMARGISEGQELQSVSGGIFLIGLGLVFWAGFSLPLLLILLGVSSLFGYGFWHKSSPPKRHDDYDYDYDSDYDAEIIEKAKNGKVKNDEIV